MARTEYLGLGILVLALLLEVLAVWLLARLGVEDPVAGLMAAAMGGALIGGLVVWKLVPRRG